MRRRVVLILSFLIPVLALVIYFSWPRGGAPSATAAIEVYQAVFEEKALMVKDKEAIYLLVQDGDPPEDVLRQLRARWPTLQPFSGRPKKHGQDWVWTVSELKWLDGSTAEVRASFSNGTDGWVMRYRVVRRNGRWQVERASTEAVS